MTNYWQAIVLIFIISNTIYTNIRLFKYNFIVNVINLDCYFEFIIDSPKIFTNIIFYNLWELSFNWLVRGRETRN